MTYRPFTSHDDEMQRRRHSFQYGYLPPGELQVDPDLRFHRGDTEETDPVLTEVLRSKLWNLNTDHGETIRRISGSNIVVEGFDFNCAITTELGDAVTVSPYSMFFAGFADEVIKWTLEHRSMNVGIRDGDVFLQDDPWVGSNHQMDTAVFSPVFVDGELFAWVFNCVHQRELGGTQPGGLIQDAPDVHHEPTFMPPIKLGDRGEIREDVVDAWVRRSRLPDLMRLELNSQLSGVRMAKRRLHEIIDRYGAMTVKRVMNRVIGETARVVGRRLESLPDATWRDERYVAGARQGDPNLYRVCMTFEKRGDRIRVSNDGTDDAIGSFNTTPGVFRASVLNGLLPTIAFDQYLCAAGVLRQIDLDVDFGAITSASHPAAVSTSMGSLIAINQAHYLGTKMVSGNPELAPHGFATSSGHSLSNNTMYGVDQYGAPYADALLDTLAGGLGAFSHRDGMDFGGRVTGVGGRFADVERFERVVPFLYLYRRLLRDSGGHGRWRGGATLASAWVGHKTNSSFIGSGGMLKSVTTGLGQCGAPPATSGHHWRADDTRLQEMLANGSLPASPAELRQAVPDGEYAPAKKFDNRLGPDDVFELMANPGAGWGDPLDRATTAVLADLVGGRLGERDVAELYGVVVSDSGSGPRVDDAATQVRRDQIRQQRLRDARTPRRPSPAGVLADGTRLTETVSLAREPAGGASLVCARCGRSLGPAADGYREATCEHERHLAELSPYFSDPVAEIGEPLVFRQYLCPGCGTALDGEVCRPSDEPFADLIVTR